MIEPYFDKDGKPLTLMDWAALCESGEYRRVDYTKANGYIVSTVWVGFNMNPLPGALHTFETAFLQPDGSFVEVYERCGTLDDAVAIHKRAVEATKTLAAFRDIEE